MPEPRLVMDTAESWACGECGESDTVYALTADLDRACVPVWCTACEALVCALDPVDLAPPEEEPAHVQRLRPALLRHGLPRPLRV